MDEHEIKRRDELREWLNRLKEQLDELPDTPVNGEVRAQVADQIKPFEEMLQAFETGMLRIRTPEPGVKHWQGQGENWTDFITATERIEVGLVVSTGRAEVMLRELCGTGEVRSVRVKYDIDPVDRFDQNPVPDSVTFIRPSEWRATEVDFESPDIEVSEDDILFWLASKGSVAAPDAKDAAIERQLALQPRPQWKVICNAVRAECGKMYEDRGWSDDRIKKRGLELLRRAGHSG